MHNPSFSQVFDGTRFYMCLLQTARIHGHMIHVIHGRKWVVPTSVSNVVTTSLSDVIKALPQRYYNVATTLSIGFLGHFTTDYSDFFLFIETWESYKSAKWHLWRPTRGGRPRKFGQFCKWLQIMFSEKESLFSDIYKVFYHILAC